MQIESWSLRRKATATFTDEEWKSLSRKQKENILFARRKLKVKT